MFLIKCPWAHSFFLLKIYKYDPAEIHHCLISLNSVVHTSYLKERRNALRTEIVQWKQELCSRRPSSCRTRTSDPAREGAAGLAENTGTFQRHSFFLRIVKKILHKMYGYIQNHYSIAGMSWQLVFDGIRKKKNKEK